MAQAHPLTDPSCYHAAFAALLNAVDPQADPLRMLGDNAATAARLDATGRLHFSDPLEPLTELFARYGYRLVRHPVRTENDWRAALAVLRAGGTIAIAADSFHLEHFWVGFGTSHALHVVVLHDYDQSTGTVGLLDPGEAVFFDGRVAVGSLLPAMCAGDAGQTWMELVRGPRTETDGSRSTHLHGRFAELAGTGARWLSGIELVDALRADLDGCLAAVGDRPQGGTGNQQSWGLGPWLLLGLWWYHHTLRWFAGHLRLFSAEEAQAGEAVDRSARDLLVVRNLMMRLGVLDACSERAVTFRRALDERLEFSRQNLAWAGTVLAGTSKESQ